MGGPILQVRHLEKSFGTHQVLRDIDFEVEKGEVISIIGSSGSGKSTLLRCINMLETPSGGEIVFEGTPVSYRPKDKNYFRSKVGMVFQSFNLFANMNALKNCMIGPQIVSVWPSPVPCVCSRICCSLTSPPRRWTQRWWARYWRSSAPWQRRESPW